MKKLVLITFSGLLFCNLGFAVTQQNKKVEPKSDEVPSTQQVQMAEQKTQIAQEPLTPAFQLKKLTQNIDNPRAEKPNVTPVTSISGLISTDLLYQTKAGFIHKKSTKASIGPSKLNLDVMPISWIQGHVGVFYASRSSYYYPHAKTSTGIDLDDAYLTLGNLEKFPVYIRVGRQYMPFGRYHRYPLLRSLPQILSEARATAVQTGFILKQGLYGAVYVYNGASKNRQQRHHMNHHGFVVGFARQHEKIHYDLSVDYLDDMNDVGAIAHNYPENHYQHRVSAVAINGSVGSGPFDLRAHYVMATRRFSKQDFAYQTKSGRLRGAQPRAFDVSTGYAFKIKDRESRIQLGYDRSAQAYNAISYKNALHLPKYRMYAIFGTEILKHTILAIEGARDRDVNKAHTGTHKFNDQLDVRLSYLLV